MARGGVVYFSNFKDCRVYSLAAGSEKGSEPVAVTPGERIPRFRPPLTNCGGVFQKTATTVSQISQSHPPTLTSSSQSWKTTPIRPHPKSKPLSS